MGYAQTLPLSSFDLGSAHTASEKEITTVAQNWTLTSVVIPSYVLGRVKQAYLDIYFPYVRNSAVGNNHIELGGIQVKKFGDASFTDAITINQQTMWIDGADTRDVGRYVGWNDLGAIVNASAGSWLVVQWLDAQAHADSLFFRDVYTVLRVIT